MGNTDLPLCVMYRASASLHAAGPADEVRVPGRPHARRLGELGRRDGRHVPLRHAPLDEAVDALGGAEARHAQPRHARAEAPESLQLLVGGHERQQVREALLGGEVGVPEGRRLRRGARRTRRAARPGPWRGHAPSSEPGVSCAPPVVRRSFFQARWYARGVLAVSCPAAVSSDVRRCRRGRRSRLRRRPSDPSCPGAGAHSVVMTSGIVRWQEGRENGSGNGDDQGAQGRIQGS